MSVDRVDEAVLSGLITLIFRNHFPTENFSGESIPRQLGHTPVITVPVTYFI
jgi:hypothetical protein